MFFSSKCKEYKVWWVLKPTSTEIWLYSKDTWEFIASEQSKGDSGWKLLRGDNRFEDFCWAGLTGFLLKADQRFRHQGGGWGSWSDIKSDQILRVDEMTWHDFAPIQASCLMQFLVKHQITQRTQSPNSPELVSYDFWLFPKLKSSLKGKRVQTIIEIQANTMGLLMVIGRSVWHPKVPTLRGLRCHCPMYNVSCIFFNKCIYFSYYMVGYLLDRPCIF